MNKKEYIQPTMTVVGIHQQHIICTSTDAYGMNKSLQSTEVESAWSRSSNMDDDE